QQQLADPALRARSLGIAAVYGGVGGNAFALLQQELSDRHDVCAAVGSLGVAYSQRGVRGRAVGQFVKALAIATLSSSRDKCESLLQVQRYWLLIQQGDAALKANNLAQAELFYQQARAVDNTDSYAVLGLGDVAMARNDNAAAERYYQQTLRMD
ncbi:cellulose biosynthesis protein BcsC, partial [Salmonella enterica subsp. enterica serovar Oslo]|nr:cellulose biosynthesis protein BcsC [Salmonella enterica subsp. enterica serovar Oslo]